MHFASEYSALLVAILLACSKAQLFQQQDVVHRWGLFEVGECFGRPDVKHDVP